MTIEQQTRPIEAARTLRSDIRARAAEIEEQRRVPEDLIEAMRERGLFHLGLPSSLDGLGLDPVESARVVEELAAADGSVGWIAMVAAQATWYSTFLGDDDVTAIWGDGGIVAGTARASGRAVAVEDPEPGYLVSGRWPFASGSTHATWFMGECVIYDGDQPRTDADGNEDTRALFVPREHVAIDDTWHTTGLRGTASHDFSVDQAFVHASRGFQMLATPPKQPWACPGGEPLVFANHGTHALGVARAAIEAAVDVMQTKKGWGGQALSSVPRLQATVAEATALVESARSYLYETAGALWESVEAGEDSAHLRARTRLATSHAVKSSVQAVDLVHASVATSSIFTSSALERPFRDIHTAAAHVMIGSMTFEAAGRVELGQPAEFPFF